MLMLPLSVPWLSEVLIPIVWLKFTVRSWIWKRMPPKRKLNARRWLMSLNKKILFLSRDVVHTDWVMSTFGPNWMVSDYQANWRFIPMVSAINLSNRITPSVSEISLYMWIMVYSTGFIVSRRLVQQCQASLLPALWQWALSADPRPFQKPHPYRQKENQSMKMNTAWWWMRYADTICLGYPILPWSIRHPIRWDG